MEEKKCIKMKKKRNVIKIKEGPEDQRKTKSTSLSARQIKFCECYSSGMSGAASARTAGYSSKSKDIAKSVASKVLKNPNVQSYISDRLCDIRKNTDNHLSYAVEKLISIIEKCSESALDSGKANIRELDLVIRSLDQYNKIFGHYSPERHLNINLSSSDIDKLITKYERPY